MYAVDICSKSRVETDEKLGGDDGCRKDSGKQASISDGTMMRICSMICLFVIVKSRSAFAGEGESQ